MSILIFIASDHAGFNLKEELKLYLAEKGIAVTDLGDTKPDPNDDYPDFVIPAAKAVAENAGSFGIVIGGSGEGEAIAANRVKGVRAAVVYDEYSAKMSRQDNDANICSLGARTMDAEKAKKLVDIWLGTPFSGIERHERRIQELDSLP